MKVSHRGLYALRALAYLAERHDAGGAGPVSVAEIAAEEGIPAKFLESILQALRNARFVASARGRSGGYELYRPPGEIRVGEVVRLVDGPLAPFRDAAGLAALVRDEERHPGLYELLLDVRNAAAAILDHTTLLDLVERDRRVLRRRARRVRRVRRVRRRAGP